MQINSYFNSIWNFKLASEIVLPKASFLWSQRVYMSRSSAKCVLNTWAASLCPMIILHLMDTKEEERGAIS